MDTTTEEKKFDLPKYPSTRVEEEGPKVPVEDKKLTLSISDR
jgi:hypothetical protein